MDNKTFALILACIVVVGLIFAGAIYGGIQQTKLKTDATVARAQEHTRRAEGRHDLVDMLGWARGLKPQREDR